MTWLLKSPAGGASLRPISHLFSLPPSLNPIFKYASTLKMGRVPANLPSINALMKGRLTKLKPVLKNVAAKVEGSAVRFDGSLQVIKSPCFLRA